MGGDLEHTHERCGGKNMDTTNKTHIGLKGCGRGSKAYKWDLQVTECGHEKEDPYRTSQDPSSRRVWLLMWLPQITEYWEILQPQKVPC